MGFIEKTPDLEKRFGTAAGGTPPTEDQKRSVAQLQRRTMALAQAIDAFVPYGRQKNLALTDLESVLMRAVKGVFIDGEEGPPPIPAPADPSTFIDPGPVVVSDPPYWYASAKGPFQIQLSDPLGTIPGWRFNTREQAQRHIDVTKEDMKRATRPGTEMDARWVDAKVIENPIV
jgi:hypothetical protein